MSDLYEEINEIIEAARAWCRSQPNRHLLIGSSRRLSEAVRALDRADCVDEFGLLPIIDFRAAP